MRTRRRRRLRGTSAHAAKERASNEPRGGFGGIQQGSEERGERRAVRLARRGAQREREGEGERESAERERREMSTPTRKPYERPGAASVRESAAAHRRADAETHDSAVGAGAAERRGDARRERVWTRAVAARQDAAAGMARLWGRQHWRRECDWGRERSDGGDGRERRRWRSRRGGAVDGARGTARTARACCVGAARLAAERLRISGG